MGQFEKILKFELKNFFYNKVFVGVTILLVALIAIVLSFPRLTVVFDDGEEGEVQEEELPVMLIGGLQNEEASAVMEAFGAAFPDYQVKEAGESEEEIKTMITDGEVECAFVLDNLTSYTYYVNTLSLYDAKTAAVDEILTNMYRMGAMVSNGITAEEAQQILTMPIVHDTKNLGKDQAKNFFYTYVMIFALYMVILMYGQMVTMNVATEKSSRAMELLITSAKPVSMMFGKVMASCLAGLIQLIAVFGSALLFFQLNKSYWAGNQMIDSVFGMPSELFVYMLIFFVLGFLIYAFLFGAIGSTVSKLEDVNTAVMPITILFIFAFMVVMFSMSYGNVDNTLMKVCSFVPFTSPMAMFTRIAMGEVAFYEILISMGILVVSVIAIGVIAAKIYRVGVLLYGTTPKMGAIINAMKKAK